MAKKNSRFDKYCTICGKHYEYCPTCSRFKNMERWHDAYCSSNCKELYNVLAGFLNNWLPPEVEAARLQKLDLSYKNKLPQWMQVAIKNLQKVDTSNAAAINEAMNKPVEEKPAEEKHMKEKPVEEKPVEEHIKTEPVEAKSADTEEKPAGESKPIANYGEKISREFKETAKTVKRYKPKTAESKN